MRIEVPTPQDAAGIAAVHVQGWREAYGHLLPERFYDDAALEQRRAMWTRGLAREDIRRRTRVARVDGRVVGLGLIGASGGEGEHDQDPARTEQLMALYVLASQYGTGAGQGLLEALLAERPAQLWVARDNPRARAFYTRNGFVADGATHVDVDLGDLAEIRMVR